MDQPAPASRRRLLPRACWVVFASVVLVSLAAVPEAVALHARGQSVAAAARPVPKVVLPQVAVAARDAGLVVAPSVRCDVCVASARTARYGEPSIEQRIDVNQLITVKLGTASLVKLTSLQPLSLFFRTRF